MAELRKYVAPTANFWSTTLNGAINDSATTITLNSTTNLQAPGYLVLNREDGSGTKTPDAREVIYFTGISGNDITGVTRGADNSTARSHADGSLVEAMNTVGNWNSLVTVIDQVIDDNGIFKSVISPMSIAVANIETLNLDAADLSNASITGLPLTPTWEVIGSISGPSTMLRTPVPMPRTGTWKYANFVTKTVASGVSALVDINKNGTSIFDEGTRPYIAAGGTFASTASIKTGLFTEGDMFTIDYDGEGGAIEDIIIQLRSN